MSPSVRLKRKHLTQTQLLSVACPTCGVAPGTHCLLYSGESRANPHVDRKLCALVILERKSPSAS
jgi:hypothetical protein